MGGRVASVSADGKTLAYTGEDGQVLLWDPAPGRALDRPLPHKGPVDSVAFSLNGKLLAAADEDVVAVGPGYQVRRRPVRRHQSDGALLRPGRVAAGGRRLEQRDQVLRRRGQAAAAPAAAIGEVPVFGLAFSPDGRQVAGASDQVEIRDVRTGHPVGEPFEGVENANSVCVQPGRQPARGGGQRTAP